MNNEEKLVYEILCEWESPPKGQHWEGFVAAKIVKALTPIIAAAEREDCAVLCSNSDRFRGDYFAALIRGRNKNG